MKLRNKKTGEVDDFVLEVITNRIDLYRRVGSSDTKNIWKYNTLAELNKEWEDYNPAEPLIKDEKIRKAVRAWAEVNNITQVFYDAEWDAFVSNDFKIEFDYDFDRHDGLNDKKTYTIAELCGEEEE